MAVIEPATDGQQAAADVSITACGDLPDHPFRAGHAELVGRIVLAFVDMRAPASPWRPLRAATSCRARRDILEHGYALPIAPEFVADRLGVVAASYRLDPPGRKIIGKIVESFLGPPVAHRDQQRLAVLRPGCRYRQGPACFYYWQRDRGQVQRAGVEQVDAGTVGIGPAAVVPRAHDKIPAVR